MHLASLLPNLTIFLLLASRSSPRSSLPALLSCTGAAAAEAIGADVSRRLRSRGGRGTQQWWGYFGMTEVGCSRFGRIPLSTGWVGV